MSLLQNLYILLLRLKNMYIHAFFYNKEIIKKIETGKFLLTSYRTDISLFSFHRFP